LTYAALAERLKCCLEAARSLVTGEVTTLKVRIESLQAELVRLETTAAGHRADYERERDWADRLVTELLKATANTTREMAAKLEGEIAALRLAAEAEADGPIVPALAAPPAGVDCPNLTNKKGSGFRFAPKFSIMVKFKSGAHLDDQPHRGSPGSEMEK
jgi:uncharacterized protein YigA (DUF484 family)